jgi:hypothetical protein
MKGALDKKHLRYYFGGLILILLIYSCFSIFMQGDLYAAPDHGALTLSLPRRTRHLIRLATILLVYLTGFICLRKQSRSWMLTTWQLVYYSMATILMLIGAIDFATGGVSLGLKELSITLSELLISPLLYILLGILNLTRRMKFES